MSNTLIDDLRADLCEAMNIRFTRTEIAAFYRVVKEAVHTITVILIVLGTIDTALCRNAVRPTWAVLVTKALHLIAQLRERGCCRGSCQTTSNNQHGILPLVVRIDQTGVHLVFRPLIGNRA